LAEALVASERIETTERVGLAPARGDFVRLAGRHLDSSFKLAGYLLGDAGEAEDAVQESLLRAWRAWSGLRDAESVGPWLNRIVVNVCRTRIQARRRVRVLALDDGLGTEAVDPFRAVLTRDAVGRALDRLTPEQRVVVVLRYWRDMPLESIAATLEVPLGTVKSRLHYAQRLLRAEIER
jgi:RNA polymerase sigma-70 factor, ECF subfamily